MQWIFLLEIDLGVTGGPLCVTLAISGQYFMHRPLLFIIEGITQLYFECGHFVVSSAVKVFRTSTMINLINKHWKS